MKRQAGICLRIAHHHDVGTSPKHHSGAFRCFRSGTVCWKTLDRKEVHQEFEKLASTSKELLRSTPSCKRTPQLSSALSQTIPALCLLLPHLEEHGSDRLREAVHWIDGLARRLLLLSVSHDATTNKDPYLSRGTTLAVTLAGAIHAWRKVPSGGPRAEELLEELVKRYQEKGFPSFRPIPNCYLGAMDAWSDTTDQPERALERIRYWMGQMEDPTSEAHNIVLKGYCNMGKPSEAEEYLRTQIPQPDCYSYNTLMKGYVKHSPRKVEQLLEELRDLYDQTQDPRYMPNAFSYGFALRAVSGKRGEGLLAELNELYETAGDVLVQPSVTHYGAILEAYARERKPDEVQRILAELQAQYDSGKVHLKPTYYNFVVFIDALVKKRSIKSTLKAEQVLKEIEKLFMESGELKNNFGHNTVMDSFSRLQRPDKVREIFGRLEELGRRNKALRPDKMSYTALIRATALEKRRGFYQKIKDLLTEMESSAYPSVRPDQLTYNVALDALSKSDERNCGEQADEIIERMKKNGSIPNVYCYNSLMNIYISSERQPLKALEVLEQLEEDTRMGKISFRPNNSTYTICIKALSESNLEPSEALRRGLHLFETMLRRWREGEKHIKPTAATVTPLLVLMSRAKIPRKLAVLNKFLAEIEDAKVEHNRVTSNALLRTYASVQDSPKAKEDALVSAVSTFQKMRNGPLGADSRTYVAMLAAVQFLTPCSPGQTASIEEIFQMCIDDGMVNSHVFHRLRHAAPLSELWPDSDQISFETIPREWRRSVSSQ